MEGKDVAVKELDDGEEVVYRERTGGFGDEGCLYLETLLHSNDFENFPKQWNAAKKYRKGAPKSRLENGDNYHSGSRISGEVDRPNEQSVFSRRLLEPNGGITPSQTKSLNE